MYIHLLQDVDIPANSAAQFVFFVSLLKKKQLNVGKVQRWQMEKKCNQLYEQTDGALRRTIILTAWGSKKRAGLS